MHAVSCNLPELDASLGEREKGVGRARHLACGQHGSALALIVRAAEAQKGVHAPAKARQKVA